MAQQWETVTFAKTLTDWGSKDGLNFFHFTNKICFFFSSLKSYSNEIKKKKEKIIRGYFFKPKDIFHIYVYKKMNFNYTEHTDLCGKKQKNIRLVLNEKVSSGEHFIVCGWGDTKILSWNF